MHAQVQQWLNITQAWQEEVYIKHWVDNSICKHKHMYKLLGMVHDFFAKINL